MVKLVGKKVILIIIMLVIAGAMLPNESFALSEMIGEADSFIQTGKDNASVNPEDIAKEFVPLGQILTIVGMGVMIAATTFMGIKYLTASPEGQAKLKEQLIGLVVAGIVVFGAYYIWSFALDVVSQFEG